MFKNIHVFGKTVKKSKEFWIVVKSGGRKENVISRETSKEASRVLVSFFIL